MPPLQLDAPDNITAVISAYEINAFAIDLVRQEIVITYNALDANGAPMSEHILIVDGPDFPAAIADASTIAGADVYTALKTALYNQVVAITGKSGTVS